MKLGKSLLTSTSLNLSVRLIQYFRSSWAKRIAELAPDPMWNGRKLLLTPFLLLNHLRRMGLAALLNQGPGSAFPPAFPRLPWGEVSQGWDPRALCHPSSPECERPHPCILRCSDSPPHTLIGRKSLMFSSLAYFHTQFSEITIFPLLLDALVRSNS